MVTFTHARKRQRGFEPIRDELANRRDKAEPYGAVLVLRAGDDRGFIENRYKIVREFRPGGMSIGLLSRDYAAPPPLTQIRHRDPRRCRVCALICRVSLRELVYRLKLERTPPDAPTPKPGLHKHN